MPYVNGAVDGRALMREQVRRERPIERKRVRRGRVGLTSTEDAGIHQAYREAGAVAVFVKRNAVQLREYLRAFLVSA